MIVPYPSLEEYLFITFQQVGHYAREDLMVTLRLLRELAELKSLAPERHYEAIDNTVKVVVREAEEGIEIEESLSLIRAAAHDVLEQSFNFRHYTAAG